MPHATNLKLSRDPDHAHSGMVCYGFTMIALYVSYLKFVDSVIPRIKKRIKIYKTRDWGS